MRTFSITTLGCKVNQYEAEQLTALLRARGLAEVPAPGGDLRIIHTCSVTIQAASKSRQMVRRATSLPVLPLPVDSTCCDSPPVARSFPHDSAPGGGDAPHVAHNDPTQGPGSPQGLRSPQVRPRVVVTGCWGTSDPAQVAGLGGVDAVLGHHDNVADGLDRLLAEWMPQRPDLAAAPAPAALPAPAVSPAPASSPASLPSPPPCASAGAGTTSLPLLDQRQTGHQRAFLKVQDGCDAHCTYCIIPKLRSRLWSKPLDDAVEEARRLVAAGHVELVLTGIFLGAYGQPTALRRRQPHPRPEGLSRLVETLCTQVPGLRRLRLSSLEPADLAGELLAVLRSHHQVVPHFHLPLQSGSDVLLRRMNRQYTRDQFLRMVDQVRQAFDRPALTTDIIVAFPGETDTEFACTLDVVDHAGFIHIHAFPFSPRPQTAAARWTRDFVRGPVVHQRLELLRHCSRQFSLTFRQAFLGHEVQVLVERPSPPANGSLPPPSLRHGRCERYFDVCFDGPASLVGQCVPLRIERVTEEATTGTLLPTGSRA